MKTNRTLLALALLCIALAACSRHSAQKPEAPGPQGQNAASAPNAAAMATPAAPPASAPAQRGVKTEMRNVKFHLTDQAAAHLETISGEIWPTGKNEMPDFDDKNSFEVRITNGKVAISPKSLASILNSYVFVKSDAPLKDLSIAIAGDRMDIKGKLHNKGDVSFETAGTLSVTPDGRIRVTTEKVKAMHLPVKGVMRIFGIELANIVNTSKIPGIDTDKNDLLMDLGTLLPPPHIRGKLRAVKLENNAIVTYFGEGKAPEETAAGAPKSYMAFEGNAIRFGKLTMDSADLVVYDVDADGELDWNQDHYREQLVAGYSKITPAFGLHAYAKDYSKLAHEAAASAGAAVPAATGTASSGN